METQTTNQTTAAAPRTFKAQGYESLKKNFMSKH